MVSGENPSVCSNVEIFKHITAVITNPDLPYLAELQENIPTIPSLGI